MSCDSNKFVITKGSDNSFTFTIKQDNSTLPLSIMGGDTFLATLINLETNEAYPQVSDKPLTVENASNGRVNLEIPEEDTVDLVVKKGGAVDRFYASPSYKLLLECDTAVNGKFIAKVDQVYVD